MQAINDFTKKRAAIIRGSIYKLERYWATSSETVSVFHKYTHAIESALFG